MYDFSFCKKFVSNISHFKENSAGYCHKCYNRPAPCLTHSVGMKPNFQGLLWLSLMGLKKLNNYCEIC
jgi:hypothetical protein